MGAIGRGNKRFTPVEEEGILDLWAIQFRSPNQIAQELKCSPTTVRRIIKANGCERNPSLKLCRRCDHPKDRIDDFHKGQSWCKDCMKFVRILSSYGLTEDEWNALFDSQRGLCAICENNKPLRVDHDHNTGAVRGLLCGECNLGLGKFKDDPHLLKRALAYV